MDYISLRGKDPGKGASLGSPMCFIFKLHNVVLKSGNAILKSGKLLRGAAQLFDDILQLESNSLELICDMLPMIRHLDLGQVKLDKQRP